MQCSIVTAVARLPRNGSLETNLSYWQNQKKLQELTCGSVVLALVVVQDNTDIRLQFCYILSHSLCISKNNVPALSWSHLIWHNPHCRLDCFPDFPWQIFRYRSASCVTYGIVISCENSLSWQVLNYTIPAAKTSNSHRVMYFIIL